jgi:hypothetical protein
MITSMMAAGVALSGFPLPPRAEVPGRVGSQHVAEIRRLTEMYRTRVYQHGADHELQRGVARLLDRATTLIGQVSALRLRRDLLDATADSAGLAAYVCRDLGQHEWAQRPLPDRDAGRPRRRRPRSRRAPGGPDGRPQH